MVTVSKQECFGLERIGIFPITDSLDRLPYLRLSLPLKAWFPYDHWRSLTFAGIASKVFSDRNDHMETKFSFCQRLPMIATITIAVIESESISAIVNDCQRSQKVNGSTSAATAAIVTILAIIWKP